jgi:hypothetical protein
MQMRACPNHPRAAARPGIRVARPLAMLAAVSVPVLPCASDAAPAHTARTISVRDVGRLHLTSHRGFTLNEQGSASGTIAGTIYIHLNIVSVNHVTAEVNIYPRGGSVTGKASASYHSSGAFATFNGTMSVLRGSGSYNHAHGSGLAFSGTVQRSNDAVTVRVSGRIST